jgi:hypothetical protein
MPAASKAPPQILAIQKGDLVVLINRTQKDAQNISIHAGGDDDMIKEALIGKKIGDLVPCKEKKDEYEILGIFRGNR